MTFVKAFTLQTSAKVFQIVNFEFEIWIFADSFDLKHRQKNPQKQPEMTSISNTLKLDALIKGSFAEAFG